MLGDREYLDQILAGIEKVNDNIQAVKARFAAQKEKA
jgi:hypothetical protein